MPDAPKPLPFHREMDFEYGVLQTLEPGLRRLVCRNPSDFTFRGTNTYVIGEGAVAIVDPGPDNGDHIGTLLTALGKEQITHVLLTHCHSDHSGAVRSLKRRTNALFCGKSRPPGDPGLAMAGPTGEGFVTPVPFDIEFNDGEAVSGRDWKAAALHTPGHAPDHLCFSLHPFNVLLSGDHVMGWNTTIIAPPEGHMGDYIASLEKLMTGAEARYYPGHGGPVTDPQRFVKGLILHRKWREGEIANALREGFSTIDRIVPKIYANLQPGLAGAAAYAVLAQLELMVEKGLVEMRKPGPLSLGQVFAMVERPPSPA